MEAQYQMNLPFLVHDDDAQKPLLHLDFSNSFSQPNEYEEVVANLISNLPNDAPAINFYDFDGTDKFEDIATQPIDENPRERVITYDFPSTSQNSPAVANPSENREEYLDTEYEKMWRGQKWFSKSFYPSKRGRKRKSSVSENDEETANNNLSCRKYRHKKSDEVRNADIKRLRTMITDEKTELEDLLENDKCMHETLNEFLNFNI